MKWGDKAKKLTEKDQATIKELKGKLESDGLYKMAQETAKKISEELKRQEESNKLFAGIVSDPWNSRISKEKPEASSQIVIYVNKNGSAYLEKEETTVLWPEGVELLRTLAGFNSYLETPTLLKNTNYSTLASLRKAIQKLNEKLKTGLELNDQVIIGKRGRGYMINSLYRIKFSKT